MKFTNTFMDSLTTNSSYAEQEIQSKMASTGDDAAAGPEIPLSGKPATTKGKPILPMSALLAKGEGLKGKPPGKLPQQQDAAPPAKRARAASPRVATPVGFDALYDPAQRKVTTNTV